MRNDNLKTHYSAKELLNLSLSCLPNSVQGIIYQAKKNGWATQKRVGKGGGVEYAVMSMPEAIQTEIIIKQQKSAVNSLPSSRRTNQNRQNLRLKHKCCGLPMSKARQKRKTRQSGKLGTMFAVAELTNTGNEHYDNACTKRKINVNFQ